MWEVFKFFFFLFPFLRKVPFTHSIFRSFSEQRLCLFMIGLCLSANAPPQTPPSHDYNKVLGFDGFVKRQSKSQGDEKILANQAQTD